MYYKSVSDSIKNSCNSGYGLGKITGGNSLPLKNMVDGVQTGASFNTCGSTAASGVEIIFKEYMHGMLGGNHWHTTAGAGRHTFIGKPASYSITGQSGSSMITACGWDRWFLDWKAPQRVDLISAYDVNTNSFTNTDYLINPGSEQTLILQDFMTVGDAVRIKLPYIDYATDGIKNQYLWIENRRHISDEDKYLTASCSDDNYGAYPDGNPGLYTYIQVGKDLKSSNSANTLYNGTQNGLASWLFPLTAEGNFDFKYRRDLTVPAGSGCANWGNANIPIDRDQSLPNPFTGFSDLYNILDIDKNGILYNGDNGVLIGLSEVKSLIFVGNYVAHNANVYGDWEDSWGSNTKTKPN